MTQLSEMVEKQLGKDDQRRLERQAEFKKVETAKDEEEQSHRDGERGWDGFSLLSEGTMRRKKGRRR